MRTIRFYLPQPLAVNASVELTGDALHHATTVLRLKVGDTLTVFNGEGGEYTARIDSISKKSASVHLIAFNPHDRESPMHTHLAIGISKGDRFDFVLQKATELGVTEMTPLFTQRTEVRLSSERMEKVQLRWQKIIISACEQSGRNRLPTLNTPVDFTTLLAQENSARKLILHPPQDNTASATLSKSDKPASVCLLVGPEGGFSDSEVALALQQQFSPLTLGPRILRTETAPLAALSVLQFVWGDLSS